MDDELFLIDTELAGKEARHLASLILSGAQPEQEFARILKATGSAEYAIRLAIKASEIMTLYALKGTVVALVPTVAGRLATFLHHAATALSLYSPTPVLNDDASAEE